MKQNTSNKQAELEKEIIFKAGEELTPMEVMNRSFKAGEKQGRLSALEDVDEMLCGFNFHQFACFNDCNYDEQEPSINYEDLIKELQNEITRLKEKTK